MDLLSTGMVLDDVNQTGCVPVSQCACLYNGTFYAPGTNYSTDCTKWYVLGSPSKTLMDTVFLRICGLVRSQAAVASDPWAGAISLVTKQQECCSWD